MRFDYSATGDSGDHPGVASLARWQQDIAIAAEQLLRTANVSRLVVLGLGLGGLLALRASVDGLIQPRHLMLWDPVVDGSEYLRELAAAHRHFMDAELPPGVRDGGSMVDARGYPTEALGSVLAPPLVDELAATDISRLAPAAELVTVICTRDTPAMRKLRASLGSGSSVTWLDMRANSDWNSEAALNNATVPIDVVEAIVRRVQETSS